MGRVLFMTLQMPQIASPWLQGGKGAAAVIWQGFLRGVKTALDDVDTGVKRHMIGEVWPMSLTAAQVSSASNFVQSGATAGLGVGAYSGAAICNGNNGTQNLNGKVLRWDTTQAGLTGGSDDHSHANGTLAADSHTLTEAEIPSHKHGTYANTGAAGTVSVPRLETNRTAVAGPDTTTTGGGGGHTHTVSGSTATGSTLPAYAGLVPVMRIA